MLEALSPSWIPDCMAVLSCIIGPLIYIKNWLELGLWVKVGFGGEVNSGICEGSWATQGCLDI